MGGFLIFIGIGILFPSVYNGHTDTAAIGIVLIVVGAILFWRTSATKAYLDNQNRNR